MWGAAAGHLINLGVDARLHGRLAHHVDHGPGQRGRRRFRAYKKRNNLQYNVYLYTV
jgi:hypothetical protein